MKGFKMGFKNYVKSKLKYLVGIATCAAIVSQLLLPVIGAKADAPRFNFMKNDYELLKGANVTRGETVWKDPVSGTDGDEFRAQIYYHNGNINTVAQNTKIKVNIPSSTTNKTAKITASISADNAATVVDTVVDGVITGQSGLTVNFDKDVNLEYVAGSAKWFPNATPLGGAATIFPNGQSGNEIVSADGVNIGNIQGCWDYSGFVIFGFKAKKVIVHEPNIIKSKSAYNQTKNQPASKAYAGDVIEYTLNTRNTGDAATDYVIEDGIADILEYADVISVSDGGAVVAGTTGNDSQMVRWASTNIGIGQTVTRTFVIKVKNPLPTNAKSGYHYDDVMYNFYGNEVLITIVHPGKPAPTPTPTPATPTPAKSLPVTGATGASFIVTFLAGLGVTYMRFRKRFDPTSSLIINDLLK